LSKALKLLESVLLLERKYHYISLPFFLFQELVGMEGANACSVLSGWSFKTQI